MEWADAIRTMKVRANADTPTRRAAARNFGAEGIGLCRTEHMFFEGDRIIAVREMILADDAEGRRAALAKILPYQRQDFAGALQIMSGLPVTIRLLDPPLHEFLPHTDEEIGEVAKAMGVSAEKLRRRLRELYEHNPMLGFRGCRLAIAFPRSPRCRLARSSRRACRPPQRPAARSTPEVMVPLVFTRAEFDIVKARIDAMARGRRRRRRARPCDYQVGTMIELPRAALAPPRSPRRPSSSPSAPTT